MDDGQVRHRERRGPDKKSLAFWRTRNVCYCRQTIITSKQKQACVSAAWLSLGRWTVVVCGLWPAQRGRRRRHFLRPPVWPRESRTLAAAPVPPLGTTSPTYIMCGCDKNRRGARTIDITYVLCLWRGRYAAAREITTVVVRRTRICGIDKNL